MPTTGRRRDRDAGVLHNLWRAQRSLILVRDLQKWGQKAPSFMVRMNGPSGLMNTCSHGYRPSIRRG
jgi:hypothetical protein